MKPAASWEDQEQHIKTAKTLADLANLAPTGVQAFRAAHPDFVPDAWWHYRPNNMSDSKPSSKMQWEIAQQNIRDAWLFQFQMPLMDSMFLLTMVFDPEKMNWDETGRRPPFAIGLDMMDVDSYPYHEAIQWLQGQSWRAKTCKFCRRCFVAEHPKRKFCTFGTIVDGIEMQCFWADRKGYKTDWWKEHKGDINADRRQEYRAKKKRSPARAKKKTAR